MDQPTDSSLQAVSLAALSGYFLRLGTIGLGGPIALADAMQRDLVEHRRWISQQEYVDGLALAQLAPGPLAAQLAMYLGFVRGGIMGATVIGFAFILPSFLMVLAISAAYVRYGGLAWMQAAFYGVGAAVIAVIARSAAKLTRAVVGTDRLLWGIFLALGISTAVTEREIVWLFLLGGVVSMAVKAKMSRAPAAAAAFMLAGPAVLSGRFVELLIYFGKASLFVFGSGLAIVPFLHGGVVLEHHWLTERQFIDAVAVAMLTPGPVVITVAFIGYLVDGPWGAAAAGIGIFLPVYLVVVIAAPHYRRMASNPQLHAFVKGVTAAAAGAIAGAVVVLARRSIYDIPTALVAVVVFLAVTKWKVPEPVLIAVSAGIGILLRG